MSVLDSSAVVAFLKNEPGAAVVADLFADTTIPLYIHSAHLCEVFHIMWRRDGEAQAQIYIDKLLDANVIERSDMDGEFWRDASALIAARRIAGASLPLGDAFGVALARRLNAEFVTSDKHEIAPLHDANLVQALFIR